MNQAKELSKIELASYLDHAVLTPDMSEEETKKAILNGVENEVYSVCVKPCDLDLAFVLTNHTLTKVSVVMDFPHGNSTLEMKKQQAVELCKYPVCDIDMVINYSHLTSGNYKAVEEEMQAIVDIVHSHNIVLKTILETDALNKEQIIEACKIASKCGVDFVKTSTGFYPGNKVGATLEVCKLMLDTVSNNTKVKGSGCVREQKHLLDLIDLGVKRVGCGCNSTDTLLNGLKSTTKSSY